MTDESREILRRTAPRYGCAGDAEIVLPGRGLHYAAHIGDLSIGGCFLEARCRLERGTAVELWMSVRGHPLRLAANLMFQRAEGAGFRFHSVTPRKLEQIHMLIAELAEDEARRKAPAEDGAAEEPPGAVLEVEGKLPGSADARPRARWWRRLARRLRRGNRRSEAAL